MSQQKTSKGLIGAGILSAIAASLCCITPVLALIAGSSGIVSFSWLEPARPYLIGVTVLVLGFAWYQKLKLQKEENCCVTDALPAGKTGKSKFIQSKSFLAIVTVFAFLMLAFPYYSKIFYPETEREIIIIDKSNIQIAGFKISGMTCEGCEEHVKREVNKLRGIIKADVFYEKENAEIQFDNSKTNITEIEQAINLTGYQVTKSEIKK